VRERVAKWRPARSLFGRIRQWVLHRVLWYPNETCDRCGGRVGIAWWCDDQQLWLRAYEHAVGFRPYVTDWGVACGLLCPRCFERSAEAVGTVVEWHAQKLADKAVRT
jgi:hypothetical protein